MAGPYPPLPPSGAEGPQFPGAPASAEEYPYPYPEHDPGAGRALGPLGPYPGPLPPPVGYAGPMPPRPRSRTLLWGLLALGLVAAVVATAAIAIGTGQRSGSTGVGEAEAKTAVQTYLTALLDGDYEVVARNNLCGMFDAIKDRRSDIALARLASDAFRAQFTGVDVTSIDTVVMSSPYQAQVLFSMKVTPAPTARKPREEEQGVAQLLRQNDQLLVCSYLLRTAGQY